MSIHTERQENEIGINIASFLPQAVFWNHVEDVTGRLAGMGYKFLSVLPLRSFQDQDLTRLSLPITFIENAWNPTERDGWRGLLEVADGIWSADVLAPKVHDFVAFPSRHRSNVVFSNTSNAHRNGDRANPGITEVVHEFPQHPIQSAVPIFTDATILEIHRGLNMTPQEILQRISVLRSMIPKIDADTKHIRRSKRDDEIARSYPDKPVGSVSSLGRWDDIIRMFSSQGKIGLVDLQATTPGELLATLEGQATELNDFVSAILESGYVGPIRVEFNMGLINQMRPGYSIGVAQDAHDYLKARINDRN